MKLIEGTDCRSVRPSPPVRGRGLKLPSMRIDHGGKMSPPVRGRGLKLTDELGVEVARKSPPVRGRGLKQQWKVS